MLSVCQWPWRLFGFALDAFHRFYRPTRADEFWAYPRHPSGWGPPYCSARQIVASAFVLARTGRHLNTEFAGFLHKMAPFGPLSDLMLRENNMGTKMIKADERYFAELSDSDNGEPVYFDNEFIEASNDQEAIGKAGEWAASHRLGAVAMLIVKQGFRGVHSRKIYLGA